MKNNSKKVATLVIGSFVLLLWGMKVSSGPATSYSATTNSHSGTMASAAAARVTTSTSPAISADAAPEFALTTLDGATIQLSDYKGDRPVIIDFWASWCHNCQRAFPKTAKLYEEYGDRVEIIGVNLKESKSVAQAFVDRAGAGFPNGVDAGAISRAYGVRYTNTHVLIDVNGNIVDQFASDLTEAHILALLDL